METPLKYKTAEDLEVEEAIDRVISKFWVKMLIAVPMDLFGLSCIFMLFDFQISYIFNLNVIPWIQAQIGFPDLWYPFRAFLGGLGILSLLLTMILIKGIILQVKRKVRLDIYLLTMIKAYFYRIEHSKYKRE